jgi:hypothetical protein
MDYKIPFKKHMTKKKELFLKTLKQMLAKNEMVKKKAPKKITTKKYIKIDGRKRLIHIGKKGGRYYIKNKKKHYIPKGLDGGNQTGGGGNQTGGGFDFSGALTVAGLFMLSKMVSEKKTIKKKSKKISSKR